MKVSIVIPVYNEMETLPKLLKTIRSCGYSFDYEIIVVDDGSKDGSREWLTDLSCGGFYHWGIRMRFHDTNIGRGAAMWLGASCAEGNIIVWMDADLEHDPADLPRLIEPILKGDADVVYGNRYLPVKYRQLDSFAHRGGIRLLTLFNSIFTRNDLGDAACGYRAFTKGVRESIQIVQRRWGIDHEFTAKVSHRGWRIAEVPVMYRPRTKQQGKKIRLRHGLQALWLIVKYNILERCGIR